MDFLVFIIIVLLILYLMASHFYYSLGIVGVVTVFFGLRYMIRKTPSLHISHRQSTNISKLVQDIMNEFELTPDNYSIIRIGNNYSESNGKILSIQVTKRNSSTRFFPLERYGYNVNNVSDDSIKVIANRLLKALGHGKIFPDDRYITKHYYGGATILGITPDGYLNIDSCEGGEKKIIRFSGFEILAEDIAQKRIEGEKERAAKRKAERKQKNKDLCL